MLKILKETPGSNIKTGICKLSTPKSAKEKMLIDKTANLFFAQNIEGNIRTEDIHDHE